MVESKEQLYALWMFFSSPSPFANTTLVTRALWLLRTEIGAFLFTSLSSFSWWTFRRFRDAPSFSKDWGAGTSWEEGILISQSPINESQPAVKRRLFGEEVEEDEDIIEIGAVCRCREATGRELCAEELYAVNRAVLSCDDVAIIVSSSSDIDSWDPLEVRMQRPVIGALWARNECREDRAASKKRTCPS